MIDWRHYNTILLDMDGTLLDLAFDNYFWRELVPRCLARSRKADPDRTTRELFDHSEFDPNSRLFVDDSERVLDAARAFGIRNVIAVTCPDSRNENRRVLAHRGVPHVASLI
jgi:FMN phosphatase YigB (HAD superfamily)